MNYTKNMIKILGLLLLISMVVPAFSVGATTNTASVTEADNAVPVTMEQAINTSEESKTQSKDDSTPVDRSVQAYKNQITSTDLPNYNKASTAKSVAALPDPLAELGDGDSAAGDISQNEFILYTFEVTFVNGTYVAITTNFTNSVGDWVDVMVDDELDASLGGAYGGGENVTTFELLLDPGNYTLVLFGAEVIDTVAYNVSLAYTNYVELPPTGDYFANALPIDFNATYSFDLGDNSSVWDWLNANGYSGYWSFLGYFHRDFDTDFNTDDEDSTWWAYFDIPEGMKYDVNMTLTYDTGDVGLWYDTLAEPYSTGYGDMSTTTSGVENLFVPGASGHFTVFVCHWGSATLPINCTFTLNSTLTQPFPLDQAFAYTVGSEVVYMNDTLLPYNVTLFSNTTYLIEIGEPDGWRVDYYGYDWAGNYDNDFVLTMTNSTGDELDSWDDSIGEYGCWLTPWLARFTPPSDGIYTMWVGPYDGVSFTVATFQLITADWAVSNAPSLSTATGTWGYNETTGVANVIDIYNIEVTSADAGKLHVIYVADTVFDDAVYYQGNLLYDDGLNNIVDSGFRTQVVYDQAYANTSIAYILDEGNYTYVLQAWFALNGEFFQNYTVYHDVYDITFLSVGESATTNVTTGEIEYFVLDAVTGTRYGFWQIVTTPVTGDDVKVSLFDADLQFARQIINDGAAGVAETIITVIDGSNTFRDSGPYKVVGVEVANGTDADFTITFNTATVPDLISTNLATGKILADTKAEAYHKIVATQGTYTLNFTSMWYNTTSGASVAWDDSPYAGTPNLWFRLWKLDGSAVAVSYASISYLDNVELLDGTYFIWIVTGDWDTDRTNLYGRCGWSTNVDASYRIEFKEFTPPAATPLSLYTVASFENKIDVVYSVTLVYGTTYYFCWDDTSFDYDAILYNPIGSEVVSGSTGYGSFIYTAGVGGSFKLFLHEYDWQLGDAMVTVRPLEVVSTHTPEHIVSQWAYSFTLESDYYYLLVVIGDTKTSMIGEGIFGDYYNMPFTETLDFVAEVDPATNYEADFAGMFTVTLYRSPYRVTTSTTTSTTTEISTSVSTQVETTTVQGGATTIISTTTEGGDGPGFEFVVLFAAAVTLFAIRRARKQ